MSTMARHNAVTLFLKSCRETLPEGAVAQTYVSETAYGRSVYIFLRIAMPRGPKGEYRYVERKIRISDHPIGMTRYLYDNCDLYLNDTARPDSWAVWMSKLVKEIENRGAGQIALALPEPALQPYSAS